MQTRIMGKTSLEVTEIGFGAYAIGGVSYRGGTPTGWAGANIFESLETLRQSWASGINFYDTADAYGRGKSEVLMGMALYYVKDKAVIASKVGNSLGAPVKDYSEPYIRGALDSTLSRLERDYLDVYMLHSPTVAHMTDDTFATMRALQAEGRIRSWGVSVNTVDQGVRAIEGGAEVLQLVYSMLEPEIGDAIFPLARQHNVGIIVREALCSGLLTGKFKRGHAFPSSDHRNAKFPAARINTIVSMVEQLDFLLEDCASMTEAALRFVLSEPAVSTVIVGCKNIPQLLDNIRADGKRLTPGQLDRIRAVSQQNPDAVKRPDKPYGFIG